MKCQISWKDRVHRRPNLKLFELMTEQVIEWTQLEIKENQYLNIAFVCSKKMVELNWELLQHKGDTDVITLDLRWDEEEIDLLALGDESEPMGELFISPTVAATQAQQYTNRHYHKELMTYIVHGILHLCGYDDMEPAKRKLMKYQERKLITKLEKKFGVFPLLDPISSNQQQ